MLPGGLFFPHVVAEEHVLVAEVEPAIRDDRMRPAVLRAALGLVEAAAFLVSVRRGFDERDGALLALAAAVEMPVGVTDRAFADSLVAPLDVAALELLADPSLAVREAVEVIAEEDHAAVVV